MKIVAFSVAPIFPSGFHGGSGRVLADVATGLGRAGHSVQMFCTRRSDNHDAFDLHPNVQVHPSLRFKETYPEPFYVPPHQLAEVVGILRAALEGADVLYVHDGELPFHFLYEHVPTVLSFQDFVYPDTLSNAMSFARDELVVASDYVRDCVVDTIGQYRSGLEDRIHVVPNGVDLELFRKVKPLAWQSELSREGYYLIGCPHRPDPAKGLQESVQLVAELKRSGAVCGEPLVLVPRWVDSRINPADGHIYRTLYDALLDEASRLGVRQNIFLHDWVDATDIAAYYSGCDVVLAIGSFVEAFGNVSVEAAACGTPSVTAQVAGHVGKLSPEFITEVPPQDIQAARDAVVRWCREDFDQRGAREEIQHRYSFVAMLDGYRQVIEAVRCRQPLALRTPLPAKRVKPAAWCRVIGRQVYNDYLRTYSGDELLASVFNANDVETAGVPAEIVDATRLERWLEEGYVVPCR